MININTFVSSISKILFALLLREKYRLFINKKIAISFYVEILAIKDDIKKKQFSILLKVYIFIYYSKFFIIKLLIIKIILSIKK